MGMKEETENETSFLGLITRYNRVQRPVYTHMCVQSFSCDTDGMNTDPHIRVSSHSAVILKGWKLTHTYVCPVIQLWYWWDEHWPTHTCVQSFSCDTDGMNTDPHIRVSSHSALILMGWTLTHTYVCPVIELWYWWDEHWPTHTCVQSFSCDADGMNTDPHIRVSSHSALILKGWTLTHTYVCPVIELWYWWDEHWPTYTCVQSFSSDTDGMNTDPHIRVSSHSALILMGWTLTHTYVCPVIQLWYWWDEHWPTKYLKICSTFVTAQMNYSMRSLTFIGPCIVNKFPKYNQQDATFLSLFISARCSTCFRSSFRPSPGAQNRTHSIRHFSDHCCYLLLAWTRWNKCLMLCVQFWAPDDGWKKNRLKHEKLLTEINKLRNVASCWLYFGNAESRISVRLRQLERKGSLYL